jgi:hypothetical protein
LLKIKPHDEKMKKAFFVKGTVKGQQAGPVSACAL